MLQIERALPHQGPLASVLLRAAAEWLVEIGQKNWEPHWFTEEFFDEYARNGELWLGWQDGNMVATFVLLSADEDFWPGALPGEALYLHKLCVSRGVAGTGVAQAMLARAEALTREAGVPRLRLDCRSDRPKLRRVYEAAGYTLIDERLVFGWFPAARFEKAL